MTRRNWPDRFWAEVDKSGDCWLWTACKFANTGYGAIGLDRRLQLAHRVAYELVVGPIPEGMDLDHTCHRAEFCAGGRDCPHRPCVNPDHLEPVTRQTNILRGVKNRQNELKTHCPQGHEYTEANTLIVKSKFGKGWGRACRKCNNEKSRDFYERQRRANGIQPRTRRAK